MPATDEEVEARQEAIAKLRAERDQAKIDAETVFKRYDNDITLAALDEEEARLQVELEQYRAQADKKAVQEAVKAQVESIGVGGVDVEAHAETEAKTTRKTAKE